MEERKIFSSAYIGKRTLGGKKQQSEWGLNDSVILKESISAQENDIVQKFQTVLKYLPFSEDWLLPPLLSTHQDNLSSHSLQRTSQPYFKWSFWAFQTLLLILRFQVSVWWKQDVNTRCIPLGKVKSGRLSALYPTPLEGGDLGNLSWSLHSGMEPLCTVSRQITTKYDKASVLLYFNP